MYTYKVMIHPNNKQATKIRRTLAKCIESNILVHKYLDSFLAQGLPLPKEGEVRKWWTIQKSILDNQTIDKRQGLTKQEIIAKHPVSKKYNSYKKSYYVDPYKIKFTDRKVKLEKITNSLKENRRVINYVSLAESNRIPIIVKYYNPRVLLEGDKFYIVVSVDDENAPTKYKAKKTKA